MLSITLPPRPGGFNPTETRIRRPAGPGRHRIRVLCAMGSNMSIRFTKANIDALEAPPKGEIFAWCSDKPGWGVRILASGRKSWVVQYRDPDGKSRRHTIGDLRIVPITLGRAAGERDPVARQARARPARRGEGGPAPSGVATPRSRSARWQPRTCQSPRSGAADRSSRRSATWRCTGGRCTA